MLISYNRRITFDTGVRRFEVDEKVFRTRLHVVQLGVRHVQRACASTGALPVHVRQDVGCASDKVVPRKATTELHAPVIGARHENHFVVAAGYIEALPTVFGGI